MARVDKNPADTWQLAHLFCMLITITESLLNWLVVILEKLDTLKEPACLWLKAELEHIDLLWLLIIFKSIPLPWRCLQQSGLLFYSNREVKSRKDSEKWMQKGIFVLSWRRAIYSTNPPEGTQNNLKEKSKKYFKNTHTIKEQYFK